MSMLQIFIPISLIVGSIEIFIYAESMCFSLEPLAFILGLVWILQSAFSIGLVVEPMAFIDGAVGIEEFAIAIDFLLFPLSLIDGAGFKFDGWLRVGLVFVEEVLNKAKHFVIGVVDGDGFDLILLEQSSV